MELSGGRGRNGIVHVLYRNRRANNGGRGKSLLRRKNNGGQRKRHTGSGASWCKCSQRDPAFGANRSDLIYFRRNQSRTSATAPDSIDETDLLTNSQTPSPGRQ
jgi:hypothetical protein